MRVKGSSMRVRGSQRETLDVSRFMLLCYSLLILKFCLIRNNMLPCSFDDLCVFYMFSLT